MKFSAIFALTTALLACFSLPAPTSAFPADAVSLPVANEAVDASVVAIVEYQIEGLAFGDWIKVIEDKIDAGKVKNYRYLEKKIETLSGHFTIVVHSVKSVDTFRARNYFVVSLYVAVFEFGEVFCFTDFLSGFLFRIRGRVRVKVGVRV